MKLIHHIALASAAALTLAACGGSDNAAPAASATVVNAYPVAADDFDKSGDTNRNASGASPIEVGKTYSLSIFPQGDIDYVKVTLNAGTTYEASINKLCATCDTYIHVYDTDGTTEITSNDDYFDLDSRKTFTPVTTGTYYIKARAYNADYGVTSYQLNVHEFIDSDGDGYSTYYDCNDSNVAVYPGATETAGDGIDQDCSGSDLTTTTTADRFEPDDTAAQAKTELTVSAYSPYEARFIFRLLPDNLAHTLHSSTDEDWIKVSVPARHKYEVDYFTLAGSSISQSAFEADGTTPVTGSMINNTDSPKIFYVQYTGNIGGIYLPYIVDYGTDKDGDGFYSQDWDSNRDCNDNNAAINPGASEIAGDQIDQDCKYSAAD